jgi:3'-5' exoribonuclease
MKMMVSEIIESDVGTDVKSCFCVKSRFAPRSYANGFMFNVTVADKSGQIDLTYWGGTNLDDVQTVYDSFTEDSVVYVSGKVGDFRGKKIDVNEGLGEIRQANQNEYELDDFVVSTNRNIDEMWNEIIETKDALDNIYLKKLLDDFFADETFVDNFKKIPAAMWIHHSCVGGLLEHTWEVLRYCKAVADVHPSLDKSLLFTGAILHDIGKIKSFTVSLQVKESKTGMLVGHIPIGTEMVCNKISNQPDFPPILKDKIIHMILSHHGKMEYGAGIEPKLPEAATLFEADMMGSKITQYIRAKKDATADGFKSQWNKYIGSIFLE